MIKLKDILNEGSKNPANIKAYYEALCKNEKITPLPVRFNNIGKGGAALTYNPKTMKALYISFNVNRMQDPEYAVIHELTHQIKLETEKDAYLGKKDQTAKFKKLENKLVEKYMYSKFSNILYIFHMLLCYTGLLTKDETSETTVRNAIMFPYMLLNYLFI